MAADVSLVTVTFGDRDAAVRVGTGLDAVQRSAGDPLMEVIVVAVGPAGREAAEQLVEHTLGASLQPEIVDVDARTGFAGAANAGVAKSTGDIVVVAKPEVTFHQRFLRRVRTEAEEKWDFLAPAVREGEGGKVQTGAAKRAKTHRLVPVADPPKQAVRVSAGNGACLVIRREALDRRLADNGALFEEVYGTGSEDLDLFWWVERQGMVVRYVPTLYVGHAVGQEILGTAEDRRRAMANYRVTVWKHAADPRDWMGWALGEAAFVSEEVTVAGLTGVRRYATSWSDSVKTANAIKKRRGRLRTEGAKGQAKR